MEHATAVIGKLMSCSSLAVKASMRMVREYDLIVIEDEITPLAASAKVNYYWPTLVAIVIVTLMVLLTYWLVRRNNYRKRLLELRVKLEDSDKRTSFTIRGIKDEIARLEVELVSDCL